MINEQKTVGGWDVKSLKRTSDGRMLVAYVNRFCPGSHSTLKMEVVHYSEMPVKFYQTTRLHSTDYSVLYNHCNRNLNSKRASIEVFGIMIGCLVLNQMFCIHTRLVYGPARNGIGTNKYQGK
jgi:hypothetical protein